MEEDLALLPLWWAEEGDCVLMPANVVYRVEADGTLMGMVVGSPPPSPAFRHTRVISTK